VRGGGGAFVVSLKIGFRFAAPWNTSRAYGGVGVLYKTLIFSIFFFYFILEVSNIGGDLIARMGELCARKACEGRHA
jgi:uncharacterized BrkB/YihY/UPF0761 family membrane protein